MADMPTAFWAGWIAVLTVTSLIGLGWLIHSVYFTASTAEEETDGPTWDENLKEGRNPAPMWWFWLIFATLIFSVIYLMLYPGLGSYAGALNWSQGSRIDGALANFEAEFGGVRKLVADAKLETLQADAALMASAQRVYDRNCAACHGYEARGLPGLFPDLRDADWQWGGEPAQIEHSVRHGRTAVMVGWRGVLGDSGVRQLAEYTKSLADAPASGHPGEALYSQYCAACHGPEGAGNPLLGAPDLTDAISLYGDGLEAINESIGEGRSGEMPAFGERLDDVQIRLLTAWLTR